MKYLRMLSIVVLIGLLFTPPRVLANVFAHNIRYTQQGAQEPFDGNFTDGTGISIRFVLSDHADSVVTVIKSGNTVVRTFTTDTLPKGDTCVVWDGKDDNGVYVPLGTYSVTLTAYDKGYASYTEISYPDAAGLSMRGMTTVNNPALKNFGFIFDIDNGGFQANTGVGRFTADGMPWGDVKGNNHLTTTGIALGPGEARWGSQADNDGYIYVCGRTAKRIYRYNTDMLNVEMVDSGYGAYYPYGLAVMEETTGKTIAVVANVNSGVATFTGDSKILSFHLNSASATYFGAKDTLVNGGTEMWWDAAFGRDSVLYATFLYNGGSPHSGVAKFDLKGKTFPLTMADTSWTVRSDSGYASTLSMSFGSAVDGSQDILYFVNARIGGGNPPTGQGIWAITGLNTATPAKAWVYTDKQENASTVRSDISVDAAGNVVYFENSNEEIAVISPSTGQNSFTTPAPMGFQVLTSSSKVMDNFEAGAGHFSVSPDYSGSTTGISTASTAARTTAVAHGGTGSMEVKLIDNTASSSSWQVRYLSGVGTPASNDSLGAVGWVGYWMRTTSAPFGASVAIGLDDPSDPATKRSIQKPVINDGAWHLYEWNIADSTQWTPWVVTSGSPKIKGPRVSIDAVWFFAPDGSTPWTLDLDDVSYNGDGMVGVDAGTGDVSGNGTVSALDASLMLQYTVGLVQFTAAQKQVGDVNLSSTGLDVNAMDAAVTLSSVVGQVTLPFRGPLPIHTLSGQPVPAKAVSLSPVSGMSGQMISIPVYVDANIAGIRSAQMRLVYDNTQLKIQRVLTTDLTSNFMVASNIQDGAVTIAMASGNELAHGGQLLNIEAEVVGSGNNIVVSLESISLNDNSVSSVTSVGTKNDNVPATYELSQNYPNPFNPSTTIEYKLPERAFVEMKIYDITGREVATLVSGMQEAGTHNVVWNATNGYGVKVASGVYIYRITAGNFTQLKKMVLLK